MRAIEYFPDTDTVYIKLRDGMIDGGEDAGEDLVIYYSVDDVPMGYEIENASNHGDHIQAALKLIREIDVEERRKAA